jgi:phosphoribosylglycinamide formyltransferase-1
MPEISSPASQDTQRLMPIVVLISGSGSNLQAIIDAVESGNLPVSIRAVISNRPSAYGLERAKAAGIATHILDHKHYADRASFDADLEQLIKKFQPGLVVLAGFMRILTDEFVNHFKGRMLNIHPSLLPKFRGLNTHQRALEAKEKLHGASVQFVTPELDGGPVIVQSKVSVLQTDTAEELAARVLNQEHIIYPKAIQWFAEGRIKLHNDQIYFDGKPLLQPVEL